MVAITPSRMSRQPEPILLRESNRAGHEPLNGFDIDARQVKVPASTVEAELHVLVQHIDPAKGVLQTDAPDVDQEDSHRKPASGVAANHVDRCQSFFLPVAVNVGRFDLANLADALVRADRLRASQLGLLLFAFESLLLLPLGLV